MLRMEDKEVQLTVATGEAGAVFGDQLTKFSAESIGIDFNQRFRYIVFVEVSLDLLKKIQVI
jgi:hypothetical protein